MNSILRPTTRVGYITVNTIVGGEKKEEIIPAVLKIEDADPALYNKYSTSDIKRYLNILEKWGLYDVKNGIWTKKSNYKELEEKRRTLRKVLEERAARWREIHDGIWRKNIEVKKFNVKYSVPVRLPMINQEIDYEVVKKGDKMNKNEIRYDEEEKEYWIPDYIDENGQIVKGHYNVVKEVVKQKELNIPYLKEGSIKPKDFLILHRSGRLGIKTRSGNVVPTSIITIPELGESDEDARLQIVFKNALDSGEEFFVFLPEGGNKKKEYGDIPMVWSPYTKRLNEPVPINKIVRKIYDISVDAQTPNAKDAISDYRGGTEGYAPLYKYDENNREYDFAPNLLGYNHVEYNDKLIIVLGTQEGINHIDNRVKNGNKMKNQFYNNTNQRIVGYTDQTSRCKVNLRLIPTEDGGVKVFGVNVKGTPEENLKSYLRGFDRTPQPRNNEEVKELIEVALEQDGRQTQFNIEHDLRTELKHLQSKTSKELYYLILGVEEELSNLPDDVTFLSTLDGYVEEFGKILYIQLLNQYKEKMPKKEQALLNVLESFKSTKDIEEAEGKGLTSDIDDLVTIENKANDSSYKKSKNLFSQQMGVLNRNQNPLRMEGGFEFLESKTWAIKSGPISFQRNEKLPKRNIPFIQRKKLTKTVSYGTETMFSRNVEFSLTTKIVKTQKGYRSVPVGVKVEREPLLSSSSIKRNRNDDICIILDYPLMRHLEPTPKRTYNIMEMENELLQIASKITEVKIKEMNDYISKNMVIVGKAPRVQETILGLNLGISPYYVRIGKPFLRGVTLRTGGMFQPRILQKVTPRKSISGRRYLRGLRMKEPMQRYPKYVQNRGRICTVRLFDDRNNPGPVWKEATLKQFKASEQNPYQFSGRIVFDKKKHEFVRVPHNLPSSFEILHTFGDGKGNIDHYIIKVDDKRLYAKGDLSLLDEDSISFTGGRNPSPLTRELVKKTIDDLYSEGDYVTISGGAKGCDTLVHTRTIRNKGKTILVLAGGFDGQYTQRGQIKPETVLKTGGLLLSEHPPEYVPEKVDFLRRNVIIASLSDKLVAFEGGNGTKHCIGCGKKLGKELLVLSTPSPIKKVPKKEVKTPIKKETKAPAKKDWRKYLEEFDKNYKPKRSPMMEKLARIADVQKQEKRREHVFGGKKRVEEIEKFGSSVRFLEYWKAKRNLEIVHDIDGIPLRISFDSTTGRGMYIDIDNVTQIRERISLEHISDVFVPRWLY